MKKKKLLIFSLVLLGLSLILKCEITREILCGETFIMEYFRFEYVSNLLDAALFVILYAKSEKNIKPIILKILLAFGLIVAYLLIVMVTNYSWQALRWNVFWGWRGAIASPLDFAQSGLKLYFKKGYPSYHIVMLLMSAIYATVSIVRRFEYKLRTILKRLIVKQLKKKNFIISHLVTTEELYEFLFKHLDDCLCEEEYETLRDAYVDLLIENCVMSELQCMSHIDALFPEYIGDFSSDESDEDSSDNNIEENY